MVRYYLISLLLLSSCKTVDEPSNYEQTIELFDPIIVNYE